MAKMIPAAERISRARKLIEKAYSLEPPEGIGRRDLSFVANVKDLLRQARDLVKFIPMTSGLAPETKDDAKKVLEEIEQADHAILKPGQ